MEILQTGKQRIPNRWSDETETERSPKDFKLRFGIFKSFLLEDQSMDLYILDIGPRIRGCVMFDIFISMCRAKLKLGKRLYYRQVTIRKKLLC